MKLTLPTDSSARKDIPLYSGCYTYFPAALAGVAMHSKMSNDKHNPGESMHHARGKSSDHADCIARHLMDLADMLTELEREPIAPDANRRSMLAEANALCWRSLALSQELHEKFGAPLAPAARLPQTASVAINTPVLKIEDFLNSIPVETPAPRPHYKDCQLDTDHIGNCCVSVNPAGKSPGATPTDSPQPEMTNRRSARGVDGRHFSTLEKARAGEAGLLSRAGFPGLP